MLFEKGQLVKHKSTDFKMVIIEIKSGYGEPNPKMIHCKYWDVNKGTFESIQFIPEELEPYSE